MSKPEFAIIIQARNGSTRLPNKMTRPFYQGYTILQIILKRLVTNFDSDIYLATTKSSKDDALIKSIKDLNINCSIYRGSEENVYSRFYNILNNNNNNYDYFMRVCADNPFLSIKFARSITDICNNRVDYSSFYDEEVPTIKTHYGLFTEFINSDYFLENSFGIDKLSKEHVTPFIYQNQAAKKNKIPLPDEIKRCGNFRLTVDTIEDFTLAQEIYKNVVSEKLFWEFDQNKLYKELSDKEDLKTKMKKQIQINSK